jgi:hypothetical protein
MPRDSLRLTADEYETLIAKLSALPPGRERDEAVRKLTGRLLSIYARHDVAAPAGLRELARRFGLPAGSEGESNG